MKTFRNVEDQERFFRRTQVDRYTHLYSATFLVPYAASTALPVIRNAVMQVEEDADFHATHIVGAVIDPVDVSTLVRTSALTPTFQMAGTSTGRADRGLDFQVTDNGNGRNLFNAQNSNNITLLGDFIPFAAVFAPGYSFTYREPIPFDYFIARKRRLTLTVRNRATNGEETPGDFAARVTFGFLGHRLSA